MNHKTSINKITIELSNLVFLYNNFVNFYLDCRRQKSFILLSISPIMRQKKKFVCKTQKIRSIFCIVKTFQLLVTFTFIWRCTFLPANTFCIINFPTFIFTECTAWQKKSEELTKAKWLLIRQTWFFAAFTAPSYFDCILCWWCWGKLMNTWNSGFGDEERFACMKNWIPFIHPSPESGSFWKQCSLRVDFPIAAARINEKEPSTSCT